MSKSLLELDREHARLTSRMASVQEEIDNTAGQTEHLERKRREFNKLSSDSLALDQEKREALVRAAEHGEPGYEIGAGFDSDSVDRPATSRTGVKL